MELTLVAAQAMAEAAHDYASDRGWLIAVAVVDGGGNLILVSKMDGSEFLAADQARGKAVAGAAHRVPTAEIEAIRNLRPAVGHGYVAASGGRAVAVRGGLPIWDGDRCVGGAGVSGARSEEDEEILRAAIGAAGFSYTQS